MISGRQVRMASHPIVLGDAGTGDAPSVTIRRHGEVVTEIHVRCTCGEHMVLDCEYETALEKPSKTH